MEQSHDHYHLHVGMRNIKTAIAATLCAILYYPFGRNPSIACIGAIFGMGSDVETSLRSGRSRLIGTAIGGFLGIVLFMAYLLFHPDGDTHGLMFPFLFIGIILLIITSQFFGSADAIRPGGVVLCIILFNTPANNYIAYSLDRILDTAVGVSVSIAVNYFFPRERVLKWLEALKHRQIKE